MKSLSVRVGVILIGLAIIGYAEVWAADWKFYSVATAGGSLHYYDQENIKPSENSLQVWTKTIYSEKDIIELVSKYGPKDKNINMGICLEEIDCKEKRIRILTFTLFSKEGEVAITGKHKQLGELYEWNYIVPDTIPEFLYKAVCK